MGKEGAAGGPIYFVEQQPIEFVGLFLGEGKQSSLERLPFIMLAGRFGDAEEANDLTAISLGILPQSVFRHVEGESFSSCSRLLTRARAVGPFVASLPLPSRVFNWKVKTDWATCFGVYLSPENRCYISHGACDVAAVSYDGVILWANSSTDIFTNGFAVSRNDGERWRQPDRRRRSLIHRSPRAERPP